MFDGLRARLDGVYLNGHPEARLPGNLNVSFAGVDGDALMMSLTEIAVSSGSACTSADPEPSHVLTALGQSDALTRASIRFGIGRFNTAADIDVAIAAVVTAVTRLRAVADSRCRANAYAVIGRVPVHSAGRSAIHDRGTA